MNLFLSQKINYYIKAIVSIFSAIAFLSSCVATKNKPYTYNQKYAASSLLVDVNYLQKALQYNHPSLYWYTSKDSIDNAFNQLRFSLTDSLTERQFKAQLTKVISLIRCGHTNIHFSKQYKKLDEKQNYPRFPYAVKVLPDTLIVVGHYKNPKPLLTAGSCITAINHLPVKNIVDSLQQLFSGDGYNKAFVRTVLSMDFAYWYNHVFTRDSTVTITYIDSTKQFKTFTQQAFYPNATVKKDTVKTKSVADTTVKKNKPTPKPAPQKISKLQQKRNISFDAKTHTAYMYLGTFSANARLQSFFLKAFKKMQKDSIKNLVIDIRSNGGGALNNSILLGKYLSQKPFKFADTVAAINTNFTYAKKAKNWLGYSILGKLFSCKKPDQQWHKTALEKSYYKPFRRYHFNGKVYILQGAYTFSAAAYFSSILKNQNNVTLVGEETGGGAYGCTAVYMPVHYLPTTKLRVYMPMYKIVYNTAIPKGLGVTPNIYSWQHSQAIKNGIDLKRQIVDSLIHQSK